MSLYITQKNLLVKRKNYYRRLTDMQITGAILQIKFELLQYIVKRGILTTAVLFICDLIEIITVNIHQCEL